MQLMVNAGLHLGVEEVKPAKEIQFPKGMSHFSYSTFDGLHSTLQFARINNAYWMKIDFDGDNEEAQTQAKKMMARYEVGLHV
jgi:hypothetical protein